ncbi:thioredoxin-like protein [Geopyxis carbonaria]|nr:thioredoxin-like protein [Geopyxis carbonaria]
MRFGPLSLLAASLAGLVLAAPPTTADTVASDATAASKAPEIPELTAKNFRDTIAKGYWFIKHHSPDCPHCQRAAPIYKALADYYTTTPPSTDTLPAPKDDSAVAGPSFTEVYDFHFGSLNCQAYGDLCQEEGVTAWPTFNIFKDGKRVETYGKKTNDIKQLTEFTEDFLKTIKPGSRPVTIPTILVGDEKEATTETKDTEKPVKESIPEAREEPSAPKPTAPKAKINPHGQSVLLDAENFQRKVLNSRDGWFVKFFAPWCGHCQAMAPAWAELGKEMEGQLNIGEVNCETEKRLCKDIHLRGYPTILFFKNGERVEYDGLRGLGDLVAYARKAVDSGIKDIDAKQFNEMEKNEELEVAFIYFYDVATTSEDFDALERLTLNLIGHAPLLKTKDEELTERFRVFNRPKLMVLRDGRPTYFPALAPQELRDYKKVLNWMRSVWLPIVPELSAANSHQIMNNRMVVLGVLNRERKDEFTLAKKELKEAAMEFMDQRQTEERNERKELRDKKQLRIEEAEDRGDDRALRAAKNMKINISQRKEVGFAWVDGVFWERWVRSTYGVNVHEDNERIIINDEDTKQYWDITVDNTPITPSRSRILETLKAILSNPPSIRPKSTSSRIERMFFVARTGASGHPWASIGFFVVLLLALAVWGRGRIRRKAGGGFFRLDGKEGGLLGGGSVAQGKVD